MFKRLFLLIFLVPFPGFSQVTDLVYQTSEAYRPKFHFSPQQGWMSDPNGMVYFEGEYHLFYQHHFQGSAPGTYWGHAVSTDLLNWKHLPFALAPDSLGYIYSGSCVVDFKNTSGFGTPSHPAMLAYFTYHKPGNKFPESQAMAYSTNNGRSWVKYSKNPVIKNPGLTDFRDPKVAWNEKSGNWLMSLAAGNLIRFYTSSDAVTWTFLSEFGSDKGNHVGPWECPDFFPVKVNGSEETKWVLLVSVVDLGQTPDRLTTATQYFIGDFDGKTFSTNQSETKWIDHGKDNYAGVTYNSAPGNRRIFQAWMQSHQYAGQVEHAITKTWAGAATFPREISVVKDGVDYFLQFRPVKELVGLYKSDTKIKKTKVEKSLKLLNGPDIFPIDIDLRFDAQRLPGEFGVRLKNANSEYLTLLYDSKQAEFVVDRKNASNAKFHDRFGSEQRVAYKPHSDTLDFRLLIDVASVEFFASEGKIVFTDTFYPTKPFDQIEIFSENGSVILKSGSVKSIRSIR
jgi:fructan beta-fructosidase